MAVFYNEIDAYPAQWLRNLIAAGHIAPGHVDERSIADIKAEDVAGFRQAHFFAGIGVWSHALRLAGWPDEREVWTGSCPCQPFSSAGRRAGTDDPRHLWPEWFRLIRECRPSVVLGEQVASRDGLAWLDIVYADMEGAGYSVGALDLCAAGFGAPHLRQRLYFVAHAREQRRQQDARGTSRHEETHGRERWDGRKQDGDHIATSGESIGLMADADGGESRSDRRESNSPSDGRNNSAGGGITGLVADLTQQQVGDAGQSWQGSVADAMPTGWTERRAGTGQGQIARSSADGDMGNAESLGRTRSINGASGQDGGRYPDEHPTPRTGPTNGFWADAEWLPCSDGKARPTQPGLFPLAHGVASRVGRLRAYGNAICAPQAAEFIKAYMEIA